MSVKVLKIFDIDCWLHKIAKQLSILEAERKRQAKAIACILNNLVEHYQKIQSQLMASGTLLIESIEDQPDTNLSYQKLKGKVDMFLLLLTESFSLYLHTYDDEDLIPLPIHSIFDHVHKCPLDPPVTDKCETCGGEHKTDLCKKLYFLQIGNKSISITLEEEQTSVYLSTDYESYICSRGQRHAYTYECPQRFPVVLNLQSQPDAEGIQGYIAPDKTWHRLNTLWRYPVDTSNARNGYLCQCGRWHTRTMTCNYSFDGTVCHHYPVYKDNIPGWVCVCGDWYALNHLCVNTYHGNTGYLCSCGAGHGYSGDCTGNNGFPFPVYFKDTAGYNCPSSPNHWHPLNTICRKGLTSPDNWVLQKGYPCVCGKLRTDASQCEEGYHCRLNR